MNEFNLTEALEKYRDMNIELSPAIDAMKDLEKQIKDHILETGEMADVDGVTVSIRSGYTRTSWDGKKLEGYAAAHPEVLAFAKETAVGQSVAVKVQYK